MALESTDKADMDPLDATVLPSRREFEPQALVDLLDTAWPIIPRDERPRGKKTQGKVYLGFNDENYATFVKTTKIYEAQIGEHMRRYNDNTSAMDERLRRVWNYRPSKLRAV
ncbi:hypothetical protein G6011_02771 [Alternaria panax]|uniref:Uncharacterized protein n=1 Tax=Alternaria panax TaxID=48097 RepID=A0AAD4FB57_9PLEO|nr:hypothetical protein G6011_02771 [Alternaria panax]